MKCKVRIAFLSRGKDIGMLQRKRVVAVIELTCISSSIKHVIKHSTLIQVEAVGYISQSVGTAELFVEEKLFTVSDMTLNDPVLHLSESVHFICTTGCLAHCVMTD